MEDTGPQESQVSSDTPSTTSETQEQPQPEKSEPEAKTVWEKPKEVAKSKDQAVYEKKVCGDGNLFNPS
jgi:hypothetical protein